MHDWESRKLEIKATPNWVKRKVKLKLFVPIRFGRLGNDSRRMEANVLTMMLQRRQDLEPKRTRSTDDLMRNILMHANPEWKELNGGGSDFKSQEQKKNEEEMIWSFVHELGQSDHKMECSQQMVGIGSGVGQLCQNN